VWRNRLDDNSSGSSIQHEHNWVKPNYGWVKCNVDAVFSITQL